MRVQEIKNSVRVEAFNFSHLVQLNKFNCPACDSIIYSRKSRFCGVCGQTLPENLLLSQPEAERLKSTLSQERSRHRAWLSKRDDHGWNRMSLQ